MSPGFFAFTLLGLLALIIMWIILSIPIYISADLLAKRSTILQAMGASLLLVLAFVFLTLIPFVGLILWIIAAIVIIALIYETSLLRAILIAIVAIVIFFIISFILALLGLALIGTSIVTGGRLLVLI
jgi:hypothetical protein